MIGIVDYGCGNIKSLRNALYELNIQNDLIQSPLSFSKYEKIIIPGVGSYSNAINKIRKIGFEEHVKFGKAYSWTDFEVESIHF